MSEPSALLSYEPPVVTPRLAGAVFLVRGEGEQAEVLWTRRSPKLVFLGGCWAVPGGAVDRDGEPGPEKGARHAALRELFEEVGVLVASDAPAPGDPHREVAREALLAGDVSAFDTLLPQGPDYAAAEEISRFVTPATSPIRYDTRFYRVQLPPGETPKLAGGELDDLRWVRPAEAVREWNDGELLGAPGSGDLLRVMARHGVHAAVEHFEIPGLADDGQLLFGEVRDGVTIFPLRTPTLPPATHTSCVLVGHDRYVVIDPATPHADEQARLFAHMDDRRARGEQPLAVCLTHHHIDHVGAATAVAERYGVPIWAHTKTAELLEGRVPIERHLDEGERVELGPLNLRCLFTPGHAPGHLCFEVEERKIIVAGDMIAGVGTIVIDPSEGDMTVYLASLERLHDRVTSGGAYVLIPSHGPYIVQAAQRIRALVEHRLQREEKVFGVLASAEGPATLGELVVDAYDDVPAFIHPLAERSLLAHLIKLVDDGRASEPEPGRYTSANSSASPPR